METLKQMLFALVAIIITLLLVGGVIGLVVLIISNKAWILLLSVGLLIAFGWHSAFDFVKTLFEKTLL